eukprot:2630906-Prymnesium_polylepis.1
MSVGEPTTRQPGAHVHSDERPLQGPTHCRHVALDPLDRLAVWPEQRGGCRPKAQQLRCRRRRGRWRGRAAPRRLSGAQQRREVLARRDAQHAAVGAKRRRILAQLLPDRDWCGVHQPDVAARARHRRARP